MIAYEWAVETEDEHGDIVDVSHFIEYAAARRYAASLAAEGSQVAIGLVRDRFSDYDQGLEDRQWAYLEDGKLPEHFSDSRGAALAKVPRRFHLELEAA